MKKGSDIVTQVRETLNNGGIHFPLFKEWEKMADLVYQDNLWNGDRSDIPFVAHAFVRLQSRFEKLTRGSWKFDDDELYLEPHERKKVFEPVLLKKEMFVCEVEKPKDYDYWGDGKKFVTGTLKINR